MFERIKPKVSIIIPSWFTKEHSGNFGEIETFWFAGECLKKMKETIKDRTDVELIIINNGSTLTDDEVVVSSEGGKYAGGQDIDYKNNSMLPSIYWRGADVLITNKENLGFAPAINQGANVARGEYILFLNNDIYIWENFLENLIEVFTHNELKPPVGVAMPNLIKKEYQKDCIDNNGRLDIKKAMLLKKEEIIYVNKEKYETGAEFGSAFLMKKELVNKIRDINGGSEFLLEIFKVGMSDDRFLWHQVRKLGFETYRTNQIRCLHRGNMTISKIEGHKKYTEENRKILKELTKN